MLEVTGCEPHQLLYVSYANTTGGALPYVIMHHADTDAVVLCIRGTGVWWGLGARDVCVCVVGMRAGWGGPQAGRARRPGRILLLPWRLPGSRNASALKPDERLP